MAFHGVPAIFARLISQDDNEHVVQLLSILKAAGPWGNPDCKAEIALLALSEIEASENFKRAGNTKGCDLQQNAVSLVLLSAARHGSFKVVDAVLTDADTEIPETLVLEAVKEAKAKGHRAIEERLAEHIVIDEIRMHENSAENSANDNKNNNSSNTSNSKNSNNNNDTCAEVRLPTKELRNDIPFFTKVLKMRMDTIYPADDPQVAVFSGHGLRIRLDASATESPGTVRILTIDPDGFADGQRVLNAPNGTRIEIGMLNPPVVLPETKHAFVVRRLADQAPWIIGRAGMRYRDLIPSRLGGSIIASHIRIPDGGPVPDSVHFHTVGFQLIFCYRGWVDLVYEDQGEPFRLYAGNCVIQPPEIRHRVLFASDNIEVIEIGVPAEHVTTIDHVMNLPNASVNPDRRFQGQRFVHHKADEATWSSTFRLPGYQSRDTTIAANTDGVAGVHVVRRDAGVPAWTRHEGDILFTFVMEGAMTLEGEGEDPFRLSAGDAFVIPPGMSTKYADPTDDIELLEVALPGAFRTSSA